jgi:AraC family transcriptional regulator of adaptative response/methylated-DNA-[protein]-cysteine methyltransferase
LLGQQQATLFDTAEELGLSGTGRLHDLFVKIEGMTPGEFKNGGQNLKINYQFVPTLFGCVLIASTTKGICHMSFADDDMLALQDLQTMFPNANFINQSDNIQQKALTIFAHPQNNNPEEIKVHLKGTDFQLKVWNALLKIPSGRLTSYGDIANKISNPKASRAVGSAIGDNPIAFIIPCHRVIQGAGTYGQYRWGSTRKSALIGWEAAKVNAGQSI